MTAHMLSETTKCDIIEADTMTALVFFDTSNGKVVRIGGVVLMNEEFEKLKELL